MFHGLTRQLANVVEYMSYVFFANEQPIQGITEGSLPNVSALGPGLSSGLRWVFPSWISLSFRCFHAPISCKLL